MHCNVPTARADTTPPNKRNLGFNDLTSLDSGIFDGLIWLEELNVRNNDLDTLSFDAFSDLSSLTTL